jgi:hypothetical protein
MVLRRHLCIVGTSAHALTGVETPTYQALGADYGRYRAVIVSVKSS